MDRNNFNRFKSQVKVNGYLTEEINVTRGIRQGCPISALLYVLIAEVLGAAIRKNEKIQGDTEIFATTDESINEIFYIIDKY